MLMNDIRCCSAGNLCVCRRPIPRQSSAVPRPGHTALAARTLLAPLPQLLPAQHRRQHRVQVRNKLWLLFRCHRGNNVSAWMDVTSAAASQSTRRCCRRTAARPRPPRGPAPRPRSSRYSEVGAGREAGGWAGCGASAACSPPCWSPCWS